MSTTVYNEGELYNHLQQLLPSGYSINADGQFLKEDSDNNRKIMLSFGIREQFPFGVYFFAFGSGICFNQVEEIIHTVRQNHTNLNWGHEIDMNTFYEDFSDSVLGSDVVNNTVSEILIENDTTFAQVQSYLQQMIDAALSFLDINQTLQQFYDLAEAMPIQEMADFYSQPLPLRRITVRKLLNEPYEDMANALIIKYTQQSRTEDAAFAQDLKNYLDNL